MKLSLFLVAVLACQAYAAPSSSILKTLQSKKSATVIVDVAGASTSGILRQLQSQRIFTTATREQKLNSVYDVLKSYADSTQSNILNMLNRERSVKPIVVEQLWVNNKIIVKNADYAVVEKLLAMDEVVAVREEKILSLIQPTEVVVHADGVLPQAGEQWGVVNIRAPEVHSTGNRGGNTVVGTIDTGVRATHEALKAGLRPSHSWFDPYSGTQEPNDQNGHGTHTMGSIAGRANGIGVAPEAEWIACKGCDTFSCTEAALLSCGQFMTCPTDPEGKNKDCSKAPSVVGNSWGGGQGDDFYDEILDAWVAADIAPVFAIGNSGPSCGSASSPGDAVQAIAVASININNTLSGSSGVGPTYRGNRIKPDIAAPGVAVVSSYYLSDTSYSTMSGTSMATPHAAGLVALLHTERISSSVADIKNALFKGAQPINSSGKTCGGVPDTEYPNNHAGFGRIDSVESIKVLKSL